MVRGALTKGRAGWISGRDSNDAAIMKNIRAIVFVTLVGTMPFLGLAQPVSAQKMFVEQVTVTQKETKPEPELKEVLPLVYANPKLDAGVADQSDAELFAPLFVENSNQVITRSVSADKVMPVEITALKGISTYFTRFHPGIDYRANMGTPVHAVLPGTVNEVSFERGGYGRYIVLVHRADGKILFSLYAHLRATKVAVGDTVDTNDVIGEVGLTGRTTGPHLHFELHDTKMAMNPIKFFTKNTLAMIMKK